MKRKRIVLPDDVELFLMLEKTFFNRQEFSLITARNGREALKTIRETRPDLIFLDFYMPDMSGDACCRIVKNDEAYRHIPLVMVTMAGREEDEKKCVNAGCDDIVHKPINLRDFMGIAQKLLQIPERGAQRFTARLLVHYGTSANNLFSDYSIDLGTGGLFLITEKPFPPDTPLHLEFILPPNMTVISCNARVAWVNEPENRKKLSLPTGMGVQFLDLTPANKDAIQEYIKGAGGS